MEIKFTCPECGEHVIEEVMLNVMVVSPLIRINDDGDCVYGVQINTDGEVSHYQCMSCGYVIEEEGESVITNCEELAEWIKAHCLKEGEK